MIHACIDCCTLIHLNSAQGINQFLLELENHIDNDRISLLAHELTIDEWEKHKEKDKKRKERRLLSYDKHKANTVNESSGNLPANIPTNTEHLDSQMGLIDALLAKAVKITTPEGIMSEFAERYRSRLAPFHKKLDSQNDWEIIGSVCNYCDKYGIRNLYFLSGNHSDFSDEIETCRTIHPDIQSRFKKVKIHYFKNYSDFFREVTFDDLFLPQLLSWQLIQNNKYSYSGTLKSNDLDSLYSLYKELYSEISFIPLHILPKFYPFSAVDNSQAYYRSFTIYHVRDVLLHFFDNVVIDSHKGISFKDEQLVKHIPDYKEKTEFVLRHLSLNLVFNLTGNESKKAITIHYHKPTFCGCYRCSFNRFEFYKNYPGLEEEALDVKEKLKFAYIHFQYGNYEKAAKIYKAIAEKAKGEKKYISYFIAKYNLKHLSIFLRNFFLHEKINQELIDELKEIDPLEEAVKLKGSSDYKLLSYIAQEDFFSSAFQKISEKRNEIVKHYYSQLEGGWSTNQHIWGVIEEFAELETFLGNNYIIFDKFSNFEKLFEIVAEALLASHAINEKQGDRFVTFDDYWIHKFIVYGKPDTIKRYFNRYNLQHLKYKESSEEKDTFIELVENLFRNESTAGEGYSFLREKSSDYLVNHTNQLFQNILTICSLLELPTDRINRFARSLLNFLNSEKILYPASFSSITYFISRKGKDIEASIMLAFFHHFLFVKDHHGNKIMEAILECGSDEFINNISDLDFENLLTFAQEKEEEKAKLSITLLLLLVPRSTTERNEKIKKIVHLQLNERFDFSLFYLAAIQDVLPYAENKLLDLIDNIDVEQKNYSSRRTWFGVEQYQNNYLDQLFNLCFKYQITTTTTTFTKIRNLNPYYEWLLDMDGFDYNSFDPEWVLAYPTTYYFQEMSKSHNLIAALVKYLHGNSHKGIERALLRLTYFTGNKEL